MATAVVFKSESADYYLYAVDSNSINSVDELKELLMDEWYVSTKEVRYVVKFTTDLNEYEVRDMLAELLEE